LFIITWKVAGEFVRLKNMTRGSNDPSSVVNTAFHSSPSFILILLYPYLRFIFMKTLFISMLSRTSNMRGSG